MKGRAGDTRTAAVQGYRWAKCLGQAVADRKVSVVVAGGAWARVRGWVGAALLASCSVQQAAAEMPRCELEIGPARAVVEVLDGETLVLDDKSEVRLIGALAPRALDGAADEGAWPLAQAAKAELGRLALGKSVELGIAGRRTDRYRRSLAQVFVQDAEKRVWVQGELLRQGHARAYGLPGSAACLDDLVAAEKQAREAGLGLWRHASYQIRPADRHWDLLRFRSTYQLVEGTVLEAADVRGRIYLNFGENWREDFTIAVQPSSRRAFAEAGMDLLALKGRRVRTRGWIERRGGPLIEIHHPGQLEILPE